MEVARTAIYVTSDLHGLPQDRLLWLLDKAGFSESDWLYILGDVIDRQGDGGVETLRWCLYQPNVQLLLGNHEAMLLACEFVFDEVSEQSVDALSAEKLDLLNAYLQNGGDVTLAALRELGRQDAEAVADILEYLREAPLYETVTAGGQEYLLVHGGLDHFAADKPLSAYTAHELLWCRPMPEDVYFHEVTTVLGHTPTAYYGSAYRGKIFTTRTWIDIDVGVSAGYPPVLLRLDDRQEIYL